MIWSSDKADLQRQRRASYVDPLTPVRGAHKAQRIDLGLALMQVFCEPGIPYTRDQIAVWCGCSDVAIGQIEQKALRKIHNRLFRRDPAALGLLEALEALTAARSPAQPTRKRSHY